MFSRKCKICQKSICGLGYYGGSYVEGMVCCKCNESHIIPYRKMENELQINKVKMINANKYSQKCLKKSPRCLID